MIRPFREASFLAQLLDADMRTKEISLYRRFIRTPSFVSWYRSKKKHALVTLRRQYMDWLDAFDVKPLLSHKNEVEVVDIYLRVRSHVDKHAPAMQEEMAKRYRDILDEMLGFLPTELQTSLHVRRKVAHGGSPVIVGSFDSLMDQRSTTEFSTAVSHPLQKDL